MMLQVTPVYALVLTLLMVALILRVVQLRWKYKVGIGDGGERTLAKAIRAHGNAAETIPLAIALMVVAELAGVSSPTLHVAGAALVIGRGMHAFGLSRRSGTSVGRMGGMIVTVLALVVLAVAAVLRA